VGGVEGGVTGGVDGEVVGGVTGGVLGGGSEGDGETGTTGAEGDSSDAWRTSGGTSPGANCTARDNSPNAFPADAGCSANAGCWPKMSVAKAISSSGNILAELAITALPRSQTLGSRCLFQQYALGQRA
jgi:hypothetical protein